MMKVTISGASALVLFFMMGAQAVGQQANQQLLQGPPARPEATCASQHVEQPNVSASDLLAKDFDIKAAVPGGLWLQKKQDVFYCNSGIVKDGETMCWKLRKPVAGQHCGAAMDRVTARDLRS